MDAIEVAAEVRAGRRSPVEACRDAIERIDRRNPALNAVILERFDAALGEAGQVGDGPFAGVPVLLKDLGACLAGLPLYQGNQLLRRIDWRASVDDPLARRLVDAGFVVLGKTNTPEFGAGVATQPRSFGPTRNPWSLEHSTSGSSGGSAAAVAAGMVPLAHGNDFGGSIRAPAAWCGVFGVKPSRGRVSLHAAPPGANAEFVLTRSLRDAAALLDVVADPGGVGRPAAGWLAAHTLDPPPSRIGVITAVDGVETEPDGARRAAEAAAVLGGLGHEIVELGGDLLGDEDWDRMQLRLRANGSRTRVAALSRLDGDRELGEDDVEAMVLALAALAPAFTDDEHAEAGAWQLAYAARLAERWTALGLDAVVTPTTGIAPLPIDDLWPPAEDPLRIYDTYRRIGCFAGCWNMTGHAAVSVPWWSPEEDLLPRGVQLVTGPGDETRLLQLAHQLQCAEPRRTAVHEPPTHPSISELATEDGRVLRNGRGGRRRRAPDPRTSL